MKKFVFALLMSVPVVCGAAEAKVKAVASFTILADLVAQVGGDNVDVTTIVGANADAHVYEPKPDDAKAVAAAEVVFVNGLGFEGFLDRLVEASGFSREIVTVSSGITPIAGEDEHHEGEHEEAEEEGHDHGAADPHAWHSIANVKSYVNTIKDGLCKADAASCAVFTDNARDYLAKLDALDQEISSAMNAIPEDRRIVITSHDAFAYLGKAYHITFVAPEGVSTESEASAADVARIIRQIRQDKASALFVENISDPRLVDQIAAETGLKVGGELYSDSLSEPGGRASTYIDLMRHNAKLLSAAMAGS
jgi:zinc/manganese transport system substrate-binding protein